MTWGRAYVSYCSLYNHIKLKHPEQHLTKTLTGRKRGRPPLTETEERNKKIYQPVDPLTFFTDWFNEVFTAIGKQWVITDWSLYKSLRKYSFEETPGNPIKGMQDLALIEYYKLNYQQKCRMTIDDVLSVYWRDISRKTKLKMYRSVIKFIIMFWEWLNQMGWEQKLYSDTLSYFENSNQNNNEQREEVWSIDEVKTNPEIELYKLHSAGFNYWQVNNAEHVPLIVNRFITEFWQKYNFGLENKFLVDFTMNLWKWLNDNDHSLLQITLILDN